MIRSKHDEAGFWMLLRNQGRRRHKIAMPFCSTEVAHNPEYDFVVGPTSGIAPGSRNRGVKSFHIDTVMYGGAFFRSASRYRSQLSRYGVAVTDREVGAPQENFIKPCSHPSTGAVQTQ